MIFVRFYGVFLAWHGNWVKDFHVKEVTAETEPPKALRFNVQSRVLISVGCFVYKRIDLKKLKSRLNFNIVANVMHDFSKSVPDLIVSHAVPSHSGEQMIGWAFQQMDK